MKQDQSKTETPAAVSSTPLLADLEQRVEAAWDAYIAACHKATQDREAIDAIVYAARHTWLELNCELQRAQSANAQAQTPPQ